MGVDDGSRYAQYGAPFASSARSSYQSDLPAYPSMPAQSYHPAWYQPGSRNAPIDLTEDAPKKRRKRTSSEVDDYDAKPDAKPAKKKKVKPKDEEKRLRRWRAHAPLAYHEVRSRALTQRMFVLDRQRYDPDENVEEDRRHPTETLSIAGTTGNVYTITIDKEPSCDCPHAMKGNQCKHVIYALARVLRVRSDLEYQLAFISSELREIFENAPPLPSETGDESEKDGNRKPVEGGECPICCVDFEPEDSKEDIVYCKAACGNNLHKDCFAQWAATKGNGNVTCPFCRYATITCSDPFLLTDFVFADRLGKVTKTASRKLPKQARRTQKAT